MVFGSVFHIWFRRRGVKWILVFSKLLLAFANFTYSLCPDIWFLSLPHLVLFSLNLPDLIRGLCFGRFLMGGGSATISILRSYVLFASMKEERAYYLQIMTTLRLLGLFAGPSFSFIFIQVDFRLFPGGPRIDKYTSPAFFAALIVGFLALLLIFTFKEFKVRPPQELCPPRISSRIPHSDQEEISDTDAPPESRNASERSPLLSSAVEERMPSLGMIGSLVGGSVLALLSSTLAAFVFLQPLIAYDNFGWGIETNYLFFSVTLLFCFLVMVLSFLLVAYVDQRAIIVFSLFVISLGFLLRVDFPGELLVWRTQFLVSSLIFVAGGYTLSQSVVFNLFAKLLGLSENISLINLAYFLGSPPPLSCYITLVLVGLFT